MKSILIDIYKINNLYSGLGQFSNNFAKYISKSKPKDISLNFLVPNKNSINLGESSPIITSNFLNRHLPIASKPFDLWHSLHQFPSHFPNPKSKQILTIHDLNFLIEKSNSKKTKYLKTLQKNVDRADYITTISEHTKSDINNNIDLKGKPIHVIHNGVLVSQNCVKPTILDDSKFFLSIGIFNPKKNFHTLLDLISNFENITLVIAGNNKTNYGEELKSVIKENQLENKVILTGIISDEEKNWLYKNCEALLFPSLAEGFGLPVIEAMRFGKPVFLSKKGSLPEIGGNQAFYFNEFSSESMTEVVKEGLAIAQNNKIEFSKNAIEYSNQFSWEKCIESYIDLYRQILD